MSHWPNPPCWNEKVQTEHFLMTLSNSAIRSWSLVGVQLRLPAAACLILSRSDIYAWKSLCHGSCPFVLFALMQWYLVTEQLGELLLNKGSYQAYPRVVKLGFGCRLASYLDLLKAKISLKVKRTLFSKKKKKRKAPCQCFSMSTRPWQR